MVEKYDGVQAQRRDGLYVDASDYTALEARCRELEATTLNGALLERATKLEKVINDVCKWIDQPDGPRPERALEHVYNTLRPFTTETGAEQ